MLESRLCLPLQIKLVFLRLHRVRKRLLARTSGAPRGLPPLLGLGNMMRISSLLLVLRSVLLVLGLMGLMRIWRFVWIDGRCMLIFCTALLWGLEFLLMTVFWVLLVLLAVVVVVAVLLVRRVLTVLACVPGCLGQGLLWCPVGCGGAGGSQLLLPNTLGSMHGCSEALCMALLQLVRGGSGVRSAFRPGMLLPLPLVLPLVVVPLALAPIFMTQHFGLLQVV